MRRLVLLAILFAAPAAHADDTDDTICTCDVTPAACDAGCACDSECSVDWSVDECAQPGAGCLPETDPDAATLATMEDAAGAEPGDIDWPAAGDQISCPAGATNQDGHCVAAALPHVDDVSGGCAAGHGAGLAIAVLLLVLARRRRAMAVLVIAACSLDGGSWDDAVDAGPTGDDAAYLDVYAAELPAGMQYLLASQPLAEGALQPVAQFSLLRDATARPILRAQGACGDRLVGDNAPGAELLGFARADAGDGTAELVELAAPDGCTFDYETDPDEIGRLVAEGYTVTGSLGNVWPPGLGDAPVGDPPDVTADAAPKACTIKHGSPVQLLYASPGATEALRFLVGCPGEVIVGEKGENGPISAMTSAAAHAAGGRTAFVLDRNGDKLRALLMRSNGVERTAAYLRHKLAIGYDYIVIDEITSAGDFADGQTFNHRLRQLLLRLPSRSILPYISIDLTQELPPIYMNDRRLLLRAFRRHARALAMEIYLHTGSVMAGAAPFNFRRAADRLQDAVRGLADGAGINAHAISVIGTSMHSSYAQYRYLDQPAHDLAAVTREVNAIRHASRRTRQQRGVGWYFVNKSDMAPHSHYTYDQLIHELRTQALRFK